MGYYVSMNCSVVVVDPDSALRAINDMHKPEVLQANASGGSWPAGEKWYSWVNNPPVGGFAHLIEALHAWRYEACKTSEPGSLAIEVYGFSGEKLGDDSKLWEAIGPFCDGVIECRGDDDAIWRWRMEPGKPMIEEFGRVVYD